MSYKLTGGWLVQRQLQYVEEVTYGTTPTSPTFVHAGPITDLSDSQETQAIKYRQIGSRDMYAMIKTGEMYSFDVTFNPLDSNLIDYAINLPGTGAGGRDIGKSLSFIKSALINGTEMYTIYKGCVADSIDISIAADTPIEVTISYICKTITTPATSHGLGTVTFGTNPTLIPWTNLSGGTNPFTWNGTAVDTPSWSTSITNNIERVKVNGEIDVKFTEPTLRDVTFEFDTFHKDATLIADQKGSGATWNARPMVYKLTGPSSGKRLTFTDAYLESLEMADATSSTTPKTESYTGTAKAVVCETY